MLLSEADKHEAYINKLLDNINWKFDINLADYKKFSRTSLVEFQDKKDQDIICKLILNPLKLKKDRKFNSNVIQNYIDELEY